MTRRAYPLDEVAEQLGVSVKTVRREIRDGRLSARRIRGAVVVLAPEVDRYLAATPEEPSSAPAQVTERRRPVAREGRVQRLYVPMERPS